MAEQDKKNTGPQAQDSEQGDPVAFTWKRPEFVAETESGRLIVAGGDVDELAETGEFLPLVDPTCVAVASAEITASTLTAAVSVSLRPPPDAADERAAFWLKHLDSEIERLQRRWGIIAAELATRETRIEQLLGDARAQATTISQLHEEIRQRAASSESLRTAVDVANARVAELVVGNAERDAALAHRARELEEVHARINAQQALLAAATVAHADLEAAVERGRRATAEATKRHTHELAASDSLRLKIQELEAYIDGRSISWSEQNAKIAKLQGERAALLSSAAAGESRLAAQVVEGERLGEKLADAELAASNLAERYREQEHVRAELEKQLAEQSEVTAAVRKDLASAQKAHEETAAALATSDELATSLERGVVRRDQTIAELERALARSRALEAQVGTENASLLERVGVLERTAVESDVQMRTLQESLLKANRAAHDADQHSGHLERLLGSSTKELEELHQVLGNRDEVISRLRADLVSKQDALDLLEHNVHRLTDLGSMLAGLDGKPSLTEILSAELVPLPSRAPEYMVTNVFDVGMPLSTADSAASGKIIIALNAAGAREYPLRSDETTIGRSNRSDIRIASPFISRLHARILVRNKEALIEDLGSKNGILVNSTLIEDATPLHDGDTISLGGEIELRYLDLDQRSGDRI